MAISYRRTEAEDIPQIRSFWSEHWGGDFMVVHGAVYRPESLSGFVARDGSQWVGLITYTFGPAGCEIVSLDSLLERRGVGTRLIEKVVNESKRAGCGRVFLVTTNDNLGALGFYQKHGFELVRVNRGAVNESRKIKSGIPLIGAHGIPLRDELELEMLLV